MVKIKNIRVGSLPPDLHRQILRLVLDSASGPEITFLSGASRERGLIHFVRGETAGIRRYRKPRDPKTRDQQQRREWWAQARHQWSTLAPEPRAEWSSYAQRYRNQLAGNGGRGKPSRSSETPEDDPAGNAKDFVKGVGAGRDNNLGHNTYMKIQTYRLPLGLALSTDAPSQPPPAAPREIIQRPSTSPNAIAFSFRHDICDTRGYSILVELTPPTKTPNRKPRETDLRWVHGPTAASFIALRKSAGSYIIAIVPNAIHDGQRYGLRIRIVTPEGVPGPSMATDFVKLASYPGP